MNCDENLCNSLKLVDFNDVDISDDGYPVIGTQALATCVGVLLYNESQKRSIVCHCSTNYEEMIKKINAYVVYYGFDKDIVKYLVIPGYYKSGYLVDEYLEQFCLSYPNFEKFKRQDISDNAVIKSDITPSFQFAFDSRNGEFVTDKVLFGLDLIEFRNKNNISNRR